MLRSPLLGLLPAKRSHRWLLGIAAVAAAPGTVFLVLDLLFPFPWAALAREPAVVVDDRSGRPLRMFLPADERWRLPVKLAELPPELPAAVVACEDRRFWSHGGVDPLAVARASWSNLAAGRVVSGASTIPMQIARLADPRPRTVGAKAIEAFRAVQLELRLSKAELLETYLDLAPYGGNVEGVGAAAWFYFGKEPAALSVGEIALLVALPRSPRRFDPTRDPPRSQEAARGARDAVLDRLVATGVVASEEAAAARRQELPRSLRPVPFAAPHFARWVAAQGRGGEARGGTSRAWRFRTTLDRETQAVAEAAVARGQAALAGEGIGNAAAVVLELPGREVRAHVGSADFFAAASSGQVDGVLARRSPGSTLKPFLYALAFDDGRLVPDSWVLDVPTDFSGYVAENFDGRYRGRVTVREALAESLNAPAVALLSEVGLDRFVGLLRRGGLDTLDRPAGTYGLPLILGSGEVTLVDLVDLYATLAEGGVHRPAAVLARPAAGGAAAPEERLFSQGAASLVAEILGSVRRPDLPEAWSLTRGVPAVAWKTGTSYGHRDAWAVGFSRRWAIGVWVGNFDGRAVQGISGSRHAGPLLFDLFRALAAAEPPPSSDPPAREVSVEPIEVCATSRQRPEPFCPARLTVPAPLGRARLPRCTLHRRVFLDEETGEIVSGRCLATRPHRPAILEVFPAELVAWRRAQGVASPILPTPRRDCGGGVDLGGAPRIVSPDPATPYRLRRDAPTEFQKIPLLARTGAAPGRLFWYQDGRLVATTEAGDRRFLEPRRGRHRLVVVDEQGRSDGVEYVVE